MKNLLLIFAFMPSFAFAHFVSNIALITNCALVSNCSAATDITNFENVSVSAVISGTSAAGTFKLQEANSKVLNCSSVPTGDWVDITGSSSAIAATGNVAWNIANAGYKCLALIYTDGGVSSGSYSVSLSAKGWN